MSVSQSRQLRSSDLALERLLGELHTAEAGVLQGADIGVVVAARISQHGTVVLAEGAQGLLQAEAFEQGQAEGLAGALVLSGGALHGAVAEGAGLVVVVFGDEGQGLGELELLVMQAGAEVLQAHQCCFPCAKAACCSAVASFWCWAFHSA